MKDSKKYSDNLAKLWRKIKTKGKNEKPVYDDPIEAMIYSIILDNLGSSGVDKCLKKLGNHFVDWNDLRVSRDEEIMEVLGTDSKQSRELAANLRNCLQAVFEKNDCLKLDYILELGKRKANDELNDLKVLPSFVEAYVMLLCLDAHCIGISEKMAEFLKENESVDSEADIADIRSFVERNISAADNYDFFVTILELAETGGKVDGNKKTTRKKTAKKTTKKTTKKKTTKKKSTKK